ncbi:dehydrogenase/reductase SDR family member 11-like [Zootermopsis nevadensis]|uniref:Dehydrogenase/reductase SDR family member 11 n=1 Tax=Zootermopsis nevadensis TaxID=136037 RepID=A0A067QP16_ZOONE|nr:dehydrogenase/reductase SDR family member 11-like [Zootermopsis nevadensis]XP_021936822.1 dehydrogenase/reductase SDR family member 11-like [Zootermopsis nevadensis]KDR10164.1 Dehydrogenase/reductase SDR family member 11 [Zootermopsis nevadensis]
MERWTDKVAVVTGSSSGIGAAVSLELVKHGMQVAGLARRISKVQELADSLTGGPGKLLPIRCDISKEDDILCAFAEVKKKLGGVDVLVNNAGVMYESLLSEGSSDEWRNMFDVNVLGLSVCTREALKIMRERDLSSGHIVHINSIAGHYDVSMPGFHMYSATKHAVTALTEGLRRELVSQNSRIRVTSVSPGLVDTEMLRAGARKSLNTDELYARVPSLKPRDVADAVVYVLAAPPHVQIHELTVKPVGEINL